jgi:hypothetical protein
VHKYVNNVEGNISRPYAKFYRIFIQDLSMFYQSFIEILLISYRNLSKIYFPYCQNLQLKYLGKTFIKNQ